MSYIYEFLVRMESNMNFATLIYMMLLSLLLVLFRKKFKRNGAQIGISNIAYWVTLIFTVLSMAILLAHLFGEYSVGQSFLGDATTFATLAGLFYIIDETNQKLKKERKIRENNELPRESLIEENNKLKKQLDNLKVDFNKQNEELMRYKNDFPSIKESLKTLEESIATFNKETKKSMNRDYIFDERLKNIENGDKKHLIIYSLIKSIFK